MVLTQPVRGVVLLDEAHVVSIPLWFLRNSGFSHVNGRSFLSFHTTMVLTQQNEEKD